MAEQATITQEMDKVQQLSTGDQSLNEILRSTEAQTQAELQEASQRSTYLKEYMELNQELTAKVNGFLEKNQTYTEKFKTMIKQPSKSTLGRFMRATPGLRILAKGQTLQPQKISEVIMDMYTNMILQKDAVSKQLGIIDARRNDLFAQSKEAAQDMETADENFRRASKEYEKLSAGYEIVDALFEADGLVGDISLDTIAGYYAELDIKDSANTKRINLVKLTLLRDDLESKTAQKEEEKKKYEIELNAASSAIKGYSVQKSQFNIYVKSVKVLLYGLETHLKYSKTIVENQAILSQAQETVIKAMEAFSEYQDAINNTLVLNSIGVQVMVRQTADLLNRDMFDKESLKEAKDRIKEADTYWDGFSHQYTAKADELSKKIQLSKIPTA